MLTLQQNLFALLVLFVTLGGSKGLVLEEGSDTVFTNFLVDSIGKYGEWIQSINEDPSSPIPDLVKLTNENFPYENFLECEIRRQGVRGHSKTTDNVPLANTEFTHHVVVIGRRVYTPYEFFGDYNCNGIIYEKNVANLTVDLPFQGNGTFTFKVTDSVEDVLVENFGITDQFTLDLSHSRSSYYYTANFSDVAFSGEWNNTEVTTKYASLVEATFKYLYRGQLNLYLQPHMHPSAVLWLRYGNEILRNANLTEILGEQELPPPYSPTPFATTSTTPAPALDQ